VIGRSIRQVSTTSINNTSHLFELPTASNAIACHRSQQKLTSASGVRKSASFVARGNSTGPELRASGECLLRRAAAQRLVPSGNGRIPAHHRLSRRPALHPPRTAGMRQLHCGAVRTGECLLWAANA
jgi:hypothetical protein